MPPKRGATSLTKPASAKRRKNSHHGEKRDGMIKPCITLRNGAFSKRFTFIRKGSSHAKCLSSEHVTYEGKQYHVGDMVFIHVEDGPSRTRLEPAIIAECGESDVLVVWLFETKNTGKRKEILAKKVNPEHKFLLSSHAGVAPVSALARLMLPDERKQVCIDWVLHLNPLQAICVSEPYGGCYMRSLVEKISARSEPREKSQGLNGTKIALKASATKTQRTSASKAKSSKKAESDSDTPKIVKEELTPEQKFEKRSKAILRLRHRLQKGFLTRDQAPKVEEMQQMAEYFTQLESHQDLEDKVIKDTKINKVLKVIIKLDSIPKEEVYNFKKRSVDLLNAWGKSMSGDAKGNSVEVRKDTAEAKSDKAATEEPKTEKAPKDVEMTDAEAPVETTTEKTQGC